MVEQILAVAIGPESGVRLAKQNKEAGVPFIGARSHDNNRGAAQSSRLTISVRSGWTTL
jgi:hypothetical protein